jgi:hypothetical protein
MASRKSTFAVLMLMQGPRMCEEQERVNRRMVELLGCNLRAEIKAARSIG